MVTPDIQAKIKDSEAELDPVLNFLREDEYRNPETTHLKKPGRENFFENFHTTDTVYHVVDKWDKHPLKCYMLVPKELRTKETIPIHCLFHGGGLATGGGNYVHWFCDYKRDLAIDANAITLIPMHRLMPEDRGEEIYNDISAWWKYYQSDGCKEWVKKALTEKGLQEGVDSIEWSRLLISGESAGGLLAVYSWLNPSLNHPDLQIRAMYLQYPMLQYYEKKMPAAGPTYMGRLIPANEVLERAEELIQLVNKQRREGRVVSRSDTPPPLGMLGAVLLANSKRWKEVFQDGKHIPDAPSMLQDNSTGPGSFPDIYIVHGAKDTAVPVENSKKFANDLNTAFRRWGQSNKVHYEEIPEAEHVFDYQVKKIGVNEADKIINSMMEKLIGTLHA